MIPTLVKESVPELRRGSLLRKLYVSGLRRLFSLVSLERSRPITKEDWDLLIVLDACRFDYFKRINWLPGSLKRKISLGSNTAEWLERNFPRLFDIVYISGNPLVSKPMLKRLMGFIPFHHIENVWDYGWDDELGTVPPWETTEAVLDADERFQDKKLIAHYMQPHSPPVKRKVPEGHIEECRELAKKGKLGPGFVLTSDDAQIKLGKDVVRRFYEENLEAAIEEVGKLSETLDRKITVTADHGELMGEYGLYGHYSRFILKELVEVPWFIPASV